MWQTAQSCNSWWRAPKQIRLAKKKEKSGHKNSLKVGWTSLSATSTICTGRHLIEFSSFQKESWLWSYFPRGELVAIIFSKRRVGCDHVFPLREGERLVEEGLRGKYTLLRMHQVWSAGLAFPLANDYLNLFYDFCFWFANCDRMVRMMRKV